MSRTCKSYLLFALLGIGVGLIFGAGSFSLWHSNRLDRVLRTLASPFIALFPSANADQDFHALAIPLTCALLGGAAAVLIRALSPRKKSAR